eukprot:4534342-Pyramimonas_sp.AAC.1
MSASEYDESGRYKDEVCQCKIERKAARRARLWTPWSRQLRLEGVRVHVRDDSGERVAVVMNDPEVFNALQAHWQPALLLANRAMRTSSDFCIMSPRPPLPPTLPCPAWKHWRRRCSVRSQVLLIPI